jgi:hypothetical protein
MTNKWLYHDKEYKLPEECSPKELYGFVYLITNKITNQQYVGKKWFWSTKTLPITKTRKRRKKLLVESNWKDYYGSNDRLNKDVIEHGVDNFKREILHLCKSKGDCSYMEAKEQFDRDVLLSENYYNGIIACKISGMHVKNLIK